VLLVRLIILSNRREHISTKPRQSPILRSPNSSQWSGGYGNVSLHTFLLVQEPYRHVGGHCAGKSMRGQPRHPRVYSSRCTAQRALACHTSSTATPDPGCSCSAGGSVNRHLFLLISLRAVAVAVGCSISSCTDAMPVLLVHCAAEDSTLKNIAQMGR
jgi:hypothetical protein